MIAIDRLIHFLILTALGIGMLAIVGNAFPNGQHAGFFHALDKLLSLRAGTLRELSIALLVYALLEGLEAVALWLTKRWAEYLTFIVTTPLIPLEIYEIIHRGTAPRGDRVSHQPRSGRLSDRR